MKNQKDFIAFLGKISDEMIHSTNELNATTEGFLDGMSRWLEDTAEKCPDGFDWEFAAKLIRAGIFYE